MERQYMLKDDMAQELEKIDFSKCNLFGKNNEELLQHIISKYPEVIPVSFYDPNVSLVTVATEMGVTVGSIDIVAISSDAIITLLEVKLRQNREIRRQILGQGLEYIASVWREYSSKNIRERLSKEGKLEDFEENTLQEWGYGSPEEFWNKLDDNTNSGRLRLIFVADRFPDNVIGVIEYLNQETKNLDLMALECELYKVPKEDGLLLIPKARGITAKTKISKTSPFAHFFEEVEKYLVNWFKETGNEKYIQFKSDKPKKGWRKALWYEEIGEFAYIWWFYKGGKCEIQLYWHERNYPNAFSSFQKQIKNLRAGISDIKMKKGKKSGKLYVEIPWPGDEYSLAPEMAENCAIRMGEFIVETFSKVKEEVEKKKS